MMPTYFGDLAGINLFLISFFAAVAPWFSPIYTAGSYTKVDQTVGDLIDWYNIQFYNQGKLKRCA